MAKAWTSVAFEDENSLEQLGAIVEKFLNKRGIQPNDVIKFSVVATEYNEHVYVYGAILLVNMEKPTQPATKK
jgi:hypothetical protein